MADSALLHVRFVAKNDQRDINDKCFGVWLFAFLSFYLRARAKRKMQIIIISFADLLLFINSIEEWRRRAQTCQKVLWNRLITRIFRFHDSPMTDENQRKSFDSKHKAAATLSFGKTFHRNAIELDFPSWIDVMCF